MNKAPNSVINRKPIFKGLNTQNKNENTSGAIGNGHYSKGFASTIRMQERKKLGKSRVNSSYISNRNNTSSSRHRLNYYGVNQSSSYTNNNTKVSRDKRENVLKKTFYPSKGYTESSRSYADNKFTTLQTPNAYSNLEKYKSGTKTYGSGVVKYSPSPQNPQKPKTLHPQNVNIRKDLEQEQTINKGTCKINFVTFKTLLPVDL